MHYPWANLSLLFILGALLVSGYIGLTSGDDPSAWILWLHGLAAYALIVLLFWKSSIILDAIRRKKRWTAQRVAFIVMLGLLLVVLLLGLTWTFNGPIHIGGFSLVSLHIYVAVPLLIMVVWHSWRMKFIFRVRGAVGRRLFLGTSFSALAGFVLLSTVRFSQASLALEGARRRFTGSYERGSLSGSFPATSWIFDYPDPIEPAGWQLSLAGAVAQPLAFSYDDLLALPALKQEQLLDCTSGWYTVQEWTGVSLGTLLEQAELQTDAVSITVEAVSGYYRRFPLAEAKQLLLAYQVAGAPLSRGHGFPLRLVAPDRRGYDWVKWVTHIEVNTTSALLQPPLPLQ